MGNRLFPFDCWKEGRNILPTFHRTVNETIYDGYLNLQAH